MAEPMSAEIIERAQRSADSWDAAGLFTRAAVVRDVLSALLASQARVAKLEAALREIAEDGLPYAASKIVRAALGDTP